jgi:hypothetical protein
MSALSDALSWCRKAIPVIVIVVETASKLASILDPASSAKKTSDIMNDLGKSGSSKPATQDRTKPSSRPNVMNIEPAGKTELIELSTVISEQGKRLEITAYENKLDHNRISLQMKILELVSATIMVERFVNNINMHAANLRIHSQSIVNMCRMLDDLDSHRYAIKRLFRVVNHTANIVNTKLGKGIEKLDEINVESNFNAFDVKLSIKLYEEARDLLLDDTEKFVEALAIQQSYVDDIREAASSVPDKAIGVSDWLNHDIAPKLAEARRFVGELKAKLQLLPPIDKKMEKELDEYDQNGGPEREF